MAEVSTGREVRLRVLALGVEELVVLVVPSLEAKAAENLGSGLTRAAWTSSLTVGGTVVALVMPCAVFDVVAAPPAAEGVWAALPVLPGLVAAPVEAPALVVVAVVVAVAPVVVVGVVEVVVLGTTGVVAVGSSGRGSARTGSGERMSVLARSATAITPAAPAPR